nr:TIGR03435 family protein [Candidatus Acidoferrales bacterium]
MITRIVANLERGIERKVWNRKSVGLSRWKKFMLASAAFAIVAAPVIAGIVNAPAIRVQDATDWQTKAGGKMAFEVASVKLTAGAPVATGFSVGPGDDYQPTGARFRASSPLKDYIEFAYKVWPSEELRREFSRLPKWVSDDRYTIEAKAPIDNPTKDQMRLMMQSLLADRFQLVVHFDAREVPVFELRLVKAGQPGPKLIPHADGPPCDKPAASPGGGLPGFTVCGNLSAIDAPGGPMGGARDMTMEVIARSLSTMPLGLDRPVIDKTGLKGSFDWTLQFTPEPVRTSTPDSALPPAPSGTTGLEALRDQLGLKVEPAKASLKFLVVDKVERPSGN